MIADTREQVADLNAAIRDRLVPPVTSTTAADARPPQPASGSGSGTGSPPAATTPTSDVANRETWTVTGIGARRQPASSIGQRPATGRSRPGTRAEHVELAYATTVHGAQGETVDRAHVVIGEHTGAASAYVGMTRGRADNTAHLVAETVEDARRAVGRGLQPATAPTSAPPTPPKRLSTPIERDGSSPPCPRSPSNGLRLQACSRRLRAGERA